MTRVDFYILKDVDMNAACRFACRLAVKALTSGNRVHIHAEHRAAAVDLDEMLWHYPEHRFVPHACEDDETAARAPLVVGWNPPSAPEGVLINLTGEIPEFFGRFERVAEIVVGENRHAGRDHYKYYRDRGYPLFHHDLDDWEAE